jgi:hypothetical protein
VDKKWRFTYFELAIGVNVIHPYSMIKVELPLMEARRLLEDWEQKEVQLEGELGDLKTAIASIRAQLNGKLPESKNQMPLPTTSGKNQKGQNLRSIQAFLSSLGGRGATTAEISNGAKIGASSVYVVLTRHKDVFTKGDDNLWRLK